MQQPEYADIAHDAREFGLCSAVSLVPHGAHVRKKMHSQTRTASTAQGSDDALDEISEDDLDSGAIAWGMQTVARLPGNIGLLRVTHCESGLEMFAAYCCAAMTLLRQTAALILDLSLNHGGDSDSAAYLISYFIDGEIELGRINFRHSPTTKPSKVRVMASRGPFT